MQYDLLLGQYTSQKLLSSRNNKEVIIYLKKSITLKLLCMCK